MLLAHSFHSKPSRMAKNTQHAKIVYPAGCKELGEDVGKDELIRRLKLLARAFQDMGQDDNESYAPLALHLASDTYMEHTNKDVRLLTACCVADMFRVFAPDAPYKESDQIKEIFMFFIQQLRGLEDPDGPSFKRYFYLLENLSWVKSFNICIELEENQEIFVALFKLFFSIINDKHTSKVKTFMLDIMSPLITEADYVSQELLESVLINMVDPNKIQRKAAFAMAKDLIKRTAASIEPYIQTFFNNMLMLGKQADSEVSGHLYELIYELNQVAPSILLAVIPQLEFKLKSNEENERKNVTKLLAKMFSERESTLAEDNKPLWLCFLGRFNDISVVIRTACIQNTHHFIINHPSLVKDILDQIKVRQHDPEESVRLDVVNSLLTVAKKDFKLMSPEMLQFVKERTLDKKFKIRREALLGLGGMYKANIIDKEAPDPEAIDKLAFVRNKVFHHYYQNTNEDRMLVERMLNVHLVPYQKPVSDRMKLLLGLYVRLDDHAVKAFSEMLKSRNSVRQLVLQLIDAHDRANEVNPPPIMPKVAQLSRTFPDHLKPQEYMKKFNLMLKDDARIRQQLKTLVGQACSCKKAEEIVKEILRKVGCAPGAVGALYQLMKTLLERIAPVMVDSLAIDHLVLAVSEMMAGMHDDQEVAGIEGVEQKGVQLLLTLSQYFSTYFESVEIFENFLTFLRNDDDMISDTAIQILSNTGSKLHVDHSDVYASLVPLLMNLAKYGSPRQAKHALRCINTLCINKEQAITNIFETIQNNLDPENANYLTAIVALGHIAQLFPDLFPNEIKSIVSKYIVKELLMKDRLQGDPTDESWCPDHQVSEETQTKVQAMKLLVRWLLGIKSNTGNSGTSTLRLLYVVIIHDGDLMENGLTNKPELARLRLQAGCCMLKLAEENCYADIIIKEQFQALALMLNDVCYQVRLRFANRLHKGLINLRLPLEYMSIFSLGANDPSKDRRLQLKHCLTQNMNKRREYIKQNPSARGRMFYLLPDYVIPYTIHLLAHDPDFKSYEDVESLKSLKECLWFVMDPLTHKHEDYNYAFLRRMIENIKQTKDAQSPDDEVANKKLYVVCDIAIGLMHAKAGNITLKEVASEPILPRKLFTEIDKNYSNLQSYLPKDFTFESKRRIGGAAAYTGSGNEVKKVSASGSTTTEIVVLSHAPVVNPLPRTPQERRVNHRLKSDKPVGEGFDSDSQSPQQSDSENGHKVVGRGRPLKKDNAVKVKPAKQIPNAVPSRKAGSRNAKAAAKYQETEEEDENEEEVEDDKEESPQPQKKLKKTASSSSVTSKAKTNITQSAKAPPKTNIIKGASTKQTKMDDFSPKGRGRPAGVTKAVNGSAASKANNSSSSVVVAKTALQSAGRGKSGQAAVVRRAPALSPPALSPILPTAVSPQSRTRMIGAESDDSLSSSRGGDDRPSPAIVRRLKPKTLRENMMTRPSPTKGSRKRSPPSSPSSTSPSPGHIKKAKLAPSESGSEKSKSPPPQSIKRGPVSRPQPVKSNIRKVGRSLVSNGTSDGEDEPETSQSSAAAEEGLNVKRKTRMKRN